MQEATLTFAEIISGARILPLSKGHFAIIDEEDYRWAKKFKWQYRDGYAVTSLSLNRAILNTPFGMEADHKNGNSLDNRRFNLRNATKSQNMQNKKMLPANTSGYKGVSQRGNRWMAKITANKKQMCLGFYATKEEAYAAYCKAAKEHHGEFARLA